MAAHCEIIYRNSTYVCFWDVSETGDKVYKYSDFVMLYPDNSERALDNRYYSKMIKKVIDNDPFIKKV